MIEPRLTSIVLLDGSQLDFLINPEFLTCDLMDMICAHLSLNDKEYFGLSFIDQTGHRNWLQMEKKILDHELPKKNGVLVLFFCVKFYIENIAFTKDKNAVELFFLQSRLLIYQGDLEINNELVFELGALVLQCLYGDYKNDKETIQNIKTQNILPKHYLANYNQISSYCEPKIISFYKKCSTLNRGQCIVNYLSIIEKLCNYGVHYYEVKDKTSTKWYLGVSYRGIGLYEANNKIIPKKIFPWSKLENLYYRDRKFSIEVHESQSINSMSNSPSSNNQNELKNNQQSLVNLHQAQQDESFNPVKVYAWFASIPSLCKSIWLMAVAQHQFYLDKKQNRHNILQFKSLNDLALELNTNNSNTSKFESIEELSNQKLKQSTAKIVNMNQKGNNDQQQQQNVTKSQMLELFKKQKELIKKNLEIKKKQLEQIEKKHVQIKEISQQALNDKTQINKLFNLLIDFKVNQSPSNNQDKNLLIENYCIESDIQKKLMFITLSLASDPHVSYIVQKQRRELYEKIKKKLSKLEKRIEKETNYQTNGSNVNKEQSTDSKPSFNEHHQHDKIVHSSSEIKLKQIDENAEISPASIHRKDSYRRAQEQKLFLDSGETNVLNKQNRYAATRKVKTIINHDQLLSLNSVSDNNNQQFIPQAPETSSIKIIKIGNNNNFIPEEQVKDGLLVETKQLNSNDSNSKINKNRNFYLNDDYLDLESRDKLNNQNINSYNINSNNSNCNNNNNNGNHLNQLAQINYPNNHMTDFITFRNQRNSRKNTSDSNVKLLADHNFYHVTNRRHVNHDLQNRENFACPDLVEPNSSIIKNGFNHNPKLISTKPYELSDYFKYSSKFKRGMNSSSNSLISLNSSSVGTNEDSAGNNNSDKDIIRSNPDLKMNSLVNSPNGGCYTNQQFQQTNAIKNLIQTTTTTTTTSQQNENYFSNSFKSDLTNLSNNLSLNLSIHTAEEFGIEMLEWLNNETTNNLIDSKLTTNATLV